MNQSPCQSCGLFHPSEAKSLQAAPSRGPVLSAAAGLDFSAAAGRALSVAQHKYFYQKYPITNCTQTATVAKTQRKDALIHLQIRSLAV